MDGEWQGVEMLEFVGYISGLRIVYAFKNTLKSPKNFGQIT